MNKEKFSLIGLKQCLIKFDEDGKFASYGKWRISNGGYSLLWELYYENQPVIDCVRVSNKVYNGDIYSHTFYANEIEVVNDYGRINMDKVIKKIESVYNDVHYYGN